MSKKQKKKINEQTLLLTVTGIGREGDMIARASGVKAPIYVLSGRRVRLEAGDEFVGKVFKNGGDYWVKPLVKTKSSVPAVTETLYGVVKKHGDRYFLQPAEKTHRTHLYLSRSSKVNDGDYVCVELSGGKEAEVVKNFGSFNLNKATATLILDRYDIPYLPDNKAEKELAALPDFTSDHRVDLTKVPLVTIDGDDAKDFDDAVWAEETSAGFNLIVAVADVCFYVRPETELDREAYRRGNSVYLPNMTIPMLPEKISNELCSLMPLKRRAAIACFLNIDKQGRIIRYDFARAVIQSAARLTYRQVQQYLDGEKSAFLNKIIPPLYGAYQALRCERGRRGALNLENSETKLRIDSAGRVLSAMSAERPESCKIIEEFMVAANNAAALVLEKTKLPVMFRVHERPRPEKLDEVQPLLSKLKLKLPAATALKPSHFNRLIETCCKKGIAGGAEALVLRLQCQAQYSPKNIGHFGLGLKDYVHFTSPIRRYADLLVHRALVRAFGWEEGALPAKFSAAWFEKAAVHLCDTERRAVAAERDLTTRFLSAYLEPAVGQVFETIMTGASSAGLFVRVPEIGAEGLIPLRMLPGDIYTPGVGGLTLEGRRLGMSFSFGEKIQARLEEASPISGGLIFSYCGGGRKILEHSAQVRSGKKQKNKRKGKPKCA